MKKTLLSIASMFVFSSSFADTSVGIQIGTLGYGINVTQSITETINVRGNLNSYKFEQDVNYDNSEYNGKAKLESFGLLLDVHPLKNEFRISTGLYLNNNKIHLNGNSVKIQGTTYPLDDTTGSLNADVTFKKIAPYLGIGWGNSVDKNKKLSFIADVGILYQETPKIDLNSACSPSLNPIICQGLLQYAGKEEASIQNDFKDYKWYPVASIGVSYRF